MYAEIYWAYGRKIATTLIRPKTPIIIIIKRNGIKANRM